MPEYSGSFGPQSLCLPLNLTYMLDMVDNTLNVYITCAVVGGCSFTDYALLTFISPSSNIYETVTEPWVYMPQTIFLTYEDKTKDINVAMYQENIVTYYSLFPFESNNKSVAGLQTKLDPFYMTMLSPVG
jgi:hypothetical protein